MSQVNIKSRAELLAAMRELGTSVLVEKLVDALLELEELRQENERLKAQLGTHSGNSSTPPSMDKPKTKAEQKKARAKARKRRKKGDRKKQGGQPGHKGHSRERVEDPDHTQTHIPDQCPKCSGPIDKSCIQSKIDPIWHQIFELVLRPVEVTEHQSPACLCPRCGEVFQLPLPEWITRAGYGPRLGALGIFLRAVAQSSTRDVVEIFKAVLNAPASLGTVSNFEGRLAEVLEIPYQEVLEAIRRGRIVNVDETTWYMMSERNVLWVATTEELVVYRIDPSKGREAFQKLLGVDFPGIVGSDRAKAYNGRDPKLRQICWSHLDRNFQKLFDAGGAGKKLASLFLKEIDEMFGYWHQYQEGTLTKEQFTRKLNRTKETFRDLLNLGIAKQTSSVHEISESLDELWDALWTFARVEGVEPTNNSAERAGRPAVTLRKTSLGSQSDRGNKFVERVLTIVLSLKKQGRNAYDYLVKAIDAAIHGLPAPSILPVTPSG